MLDVRADTDKQFEVVALPAVAALDQCAVAQPPP